MARKLKKKLKIVQHNSKNYEIMTLRTGLKIFIFWTENNNKKKTHKRIKNEPKTIIYLYVRYIYIRGVKSSETFLKSLCRSKIVFHLEF